MDGLEVTRMLAGPQVADPIRVIVVTTFDLDDYVHTALRNGACGFLLKRSSPTLLAEAVRAAMSGDTLISPQITVRLLRALSTPPPSTGRDETVPLTNRELEITRMVAMGPHQRRDRHRPVHLARHRKESRRGDSAQARRTQPGRHRRLGLGHRSRRPMTAAQR
jgi:DNA-binding response OmpR family regulator